METLNCFTRSLSDRISSVAPLDGGSVTITNRDTAVNTTIRTITGQYCFWRRAIVPPPGGGPPHGVDGGRGPATGSEKRGQAPRFSAVSVGRTRELSGSPIFRFSAAAIP